MYWYKAFGFFFIYLFLYKYEMIPIYNVDTMIIVIYHRIRKYLLIFYVDMIKTKPRSWKKERVKCKI